MNKIMIVDDVPSNRSILKNILLKNIEEALILEAADGKTALETVLNTDIDVIILDIMMPEIDGLEVLERLKNNPRTSNIPVLMYTAVHESECLKKALQLGALDYFTKPLTQEQMRIQVPLKIKNALIYYEQRKEILRYNEQVKGELELAGQLQSSMVSEYMVTSSAFMWGRYIPCENVGGDMYCIKEKDGVLWFMIADTTGHGIPAAMVSSIIKVAFIAGVELCKDTGEMLAYINNTLSGLFKDSFWGITSAFVGRLEGERLYFSNAGHPVPVIYDNSMNRFHQLTSYGVLLGAFIDLEYKTCEIDFIKGSKIILYTDGLFDKGTANSFTGWDRVESFCKSNEKSLLDDSKAFLESLIAFFSDNGVKGFIDDVAVMVIQSK